MSIENETSLPPRPGGCGNVGCLGGFMITVGILLVVGLCGGGGLYFWASNQVTKYTQDKPVELPTIELPADQLANLEARLSSFKQAVEEKDEVKDNDNDNDEDKPNAKPQDELVLTAEEINALIAKNKDARGKLFVKIENGQVGGDVSIPMDKVPGGKGRYFNGSVTFDVSMESGVLIVTLADAKVGDESVPQSFIDQVAKENLAKDMYKDPESAKMMRRFDTISIEDDKIVLRLKAKPEPGAQESSEQSATPEDAATE